MNAADEAAAVIAAKRNELESSIYEMRGAVHRTHGNLIDAAALDPLLEAMEEWLYSDEAEACDLAGMTAKAETYFAAVGAATAAYAAAVEAERLATEAEIDAEAAAGAAEREAEGGDDDHDFRKLKYPDRLRMVTKNKEEGTELFKGGNVVPATKRCVEKALLLLLLRSRSLLLRLATTNSLTHVEKAGPQQK